MHGQQNDKYTEMHGQQNSQNFKCVCWSQTHCLIAYISSSLYLALLLMCSIFVKNLIFKYRFCLRYVGWT
jgi:hypothetical protein